MSFRSLLALQRASYHQRSGRKAKAALLLNSAIEKSDQDVRLLIRRGIVADSRDNFEKAATSKTNRAAYFYLAIDSVMQGDYVEAKKNLMEAKTRSPHNLSISALAAVLSLKEGDDPVKALAVLVAAMPGSTGLVGAFALYEVESAILRLDPENRGAREKEIVIGGPVGWLLERLDDIASIIYWVLNHLLNLVINVTRPKRRQAWRHTIQGMFLESFGERTRAAERFRKALTYDSLNRDALESLIVYHLNDEDPYRAEPYLKRMERQAEEEGYDDPRLISLRADINYLRRSYDKAAGKYKTAAAKDPLAFFPRYRLGLALLKSEKNQEAVKAFADALDKINPNLLHERIETLSGLIKSQPVPPFPEAETG